MRGNKVTIAGRRRGHLDEVIAVNPGMAAIELDITDAASIDRVAAQLIADYPELNVLINNAGIMPAGPGGRPDLRRADGVHHHDQPHGANPHDVMR
jgi:uncharacterized oxidoreductase